jgi:hypothetical protein
MPVTTQSATVVSHAIRERGTGAYSGGASDMTAISPELAVAYLRELSWGARAISVHGSDGELLAGDEPDQGGDVVRAHDAHHEIAVALGPQALPALAAQDAEMALEALIRPGFPP